MRYDIVLASASPRRRELLERAGVLFSVHAVDVDESLSAELKARPLEAVRMLANRKARAAIDELIESGETGPVAVIGSDTMVVLDGEIFGKPRDGADAHRMLRALSGRAHDVNTAVSVWLAGGESARVPTCRHSFVDTTRVHFRELSDTDIDAYIATGDPFDKAGAYGIQSGAAAFVDHIDGALDTVIGLPIARLLREVPELEPGD